MIVAISGITGFVGRHLEEYISERGDTIIPINRKVFALSDNEALKYLNGVDAIINLAGALVIKRWTKNHRQTIIKSRVNTTEKLVKWVQQMPEKPKVFINASAIGIYDYVAEHDEFSTAYGNTFLSEVVQQWEEAVEPLKETEVRCCIARLGVVMGKDGGAFPKLKQVFKLGLGGKMASGEQAMSYIHIRDVVGAFYFLLNKDKTQGIYNFVAPNYTTNSGMIRVIAAAMGKPAIFNIPAFVLKLLYGEASQVVIGGEKVLPKRLLDEDFIYQYPTIEATVYNLVNT